LIDINNQKARGINLPVTVITSKGQVASCATKVSGILQMPRDDAHHPRTASCNRSTGWLNGSVHASPPIAAPTHPPTTV
jgi:hypothetical protein